jgi:hypothetical protein
MKALVVAMLAFAAVSANAASYKSAADANPGQMVTLSCGKQVPAKMLKSREYAEAMPSQSAPRGSSHGQQGADGNPRG